MSGIPIEPADISTSVWGGHITADEKRTSKCTIVKYSLVSTNEVQFIMNIGWVKYDTYSEQDVQVPEFHFSSSIRINK